MAPDAPELEPIFALVAARTGTSLSRQQRGRLDAAVRARLLGRSPSDYLAHLSSGKAAHELAELLAVISVHKTDLFRDEQQLEALLRHVLEPLARKGRAVSVWSAGCSTGEEVATLLILLAQAGASPTSRVLGTDISREAVEVARRQEFSRDVVRRASREVLERYFVRNGDRHALSMELRLRANFLVHNLMDLPYPMPEGRPEFDVIVCRNVFIYFTAEAVDQTVGRLAERLAPGGTLVLSAAEPILKTRTDLETVRFGNVFLYRKADPLAATATPVPPPPRASAPRLLRPSAPRPSAPRPTAPASAALPSTSDADLPAVQRTPKEEGQALFELVMEWAAAGEPEADTEAGLRKALYLAPELAAARYLLGLLLERKGEKADAASEYRRAVQLLSSGAAEPTAFFLNTERLLKACEVALARLGYRAP